jgi:hypothetical protein
MYDTIDFKLMQDNVKDTEFISETINLLDTVKETRYPNGQLYLNGNLNGLNVSISEDSLRINKTSLCKYYLGNNIKTLTREATKEAIEKISDELHLNMHLAEVKRIDVATNFIVKNYELQYFKYLGDLQHYSRLEQNKGLYYNNSKRTALFYCKLIELRSKRVRVPEIYNGLNMLRFELRLQKKLFKEFNTNQILGQDLYDEHFYNNVVNKWRETYFNIKKMNEALTQIKPTGSSKEFIEYLAFMTINEANQTNIIKLINESRERGFITKKQAMDLRNKIKQLNSNSNITQTSKLITEIDEKVIQSIEHIL